MATQKNKTKRALSSSDEEGDSSSNTWPRFIIIKSSTNLLKLSTFAGISVKSTAHKTLNSNKGTIRDTERILQGVPEEEILEGLSSQGVTHVKRFMRKRDGNTIPLNSRLQYHSCSAFHSKRSSLLQVPEVRAWCIPLHQPSSLPSLRR